MTENATARIDTLETQLARGVRRITARTVERFGALLSEKLRDTDPVLRTAYLRMLVSDVTVSTNRILISGPKAALENGVANGVPRLEGTMPIFDQKWCPMPNQDGHSNHWEILVDLV